MDTDTAMADDARDEFLGDGGTGVIAFGTGGGDPPHAVPVSYGYDDETATFFFRLAVDEESEKGDPAGRQVTFVAYGDGDGWRSVVASGELEETDEESVSAASLAALERVHIPIVDIFGRPAKEVPFRFFRLVPDSLTAREESSTAT